ncbi:hypothetical protein [[Mycoplasma] testudinis]|uniref:hypothetical protein n=1 Tax=[Mycoplasma] testudinis TaxID=33924 RepID=UPI00047F6F05|nr:hypothetical protein [[Mycoplasma] testudinis]
MNNPAVEDTEIDSLQGNEDPSANEAVFGNLWDGSEPVDPNAVEQEEEFQLPEDGSIQIAYDAEGNGYYISYNYDTGDYQDPWSGDVYDISLLYDEQGNPFHFFGEEPAAAVEPVVEEVPATPETAYEVPQEVAAEPVAEPVYEEVPQVTYEAPVGVNPEPVAPVVAEAPTLETVEPETVPVHEEPAPVVAEAPVYQEPTPVIASQPEVAPPLETPVHQEPTPVVVSQPEVAPALETPVHQEPTPVVALQPEVAPVVETPVHEEPALVVEAPVYQEPTPVFASQPEVAPALETPLYQEPAPVVASQPEVAPVVETPVYQEPAAVVASQPEIIQPQPLITEQPEPIVSSVSEPDSVSSQPLSEQTITSFEPTINEQPVAAPVIEPVHFEPEVATENFEFTKSDDSTSTPTSHDTSLELTPVVDEQLVQSVLSHESHDEIHKPEVEEFVPVRMDEQNEGVYVIDQHKPVVEDLVPLLPEEQAHGSYDKEDTVETKHEDLSTEEFIPMPSHDHHHEEEFIPMPSHDHHHEEEFIPMPSHDHNHDEQSPALELSDEEKQPETEVAFDDIQKPEEIIYTVVEEEQPVEFETKVEVAEEPSQPWYLQLPEESEQAEVVAPTTTVIEEEAAAVDFSDSDLQEKATTVDSDVSIEQEKPPVVVESNDESQSPEVKKAFWELHIGNPEYGHVGENNKWVWDGFFYDNGTFVSSRVAPSVVVKPESVSAIDEVVGHVEPSPEQDLNTIQDVLFEKPEEVFVPIKEPQSHAERYGNSKYDGDVVILDDQQAQQALNHVEREVIEVEPVSEPVVETIEPIKPVETFETKPEVEEIQPEPIMSEPKTNLPTRIVSPAEKLEALTSEIVSGEPTDISEDDLFGTSSYDQKIKETLIHMLDFLKKAKSEATTVFKTISKELRLEIDAIVADNEKLRLEFKDNEGRISSKKSELLRTITNDFKPGNNYNTGKDFESLQHAQDYNKHLSSTITENEARLQVLTNNLAQLKNVYDKRMTKLANDTVRIQRLVSGLDGSNRDLSQIEANYYNLLKAHDEYRSRLNNFAPTNFAKPTPTSLVQFNSPVYAPTGLTNPAYDSLNAFDSTAYSDFSSNAFYNSELPIFDFAQPKLLNPTKSLFDDNGFGSFKKSSSFADDILKPLSTNKRSSLNFMDDILDSDFELLKPDRTTTNLDDLFADDNNFSSGSDDLFNDNYDAKASLTDELEDLLGR